MAFCVHCGKQVAAHDRFCAGCGHGQPTTGGDAPGEKPTGIVSSRNFPFGTKTCCEAFLPGIAPGLEFFAMQDELEGILGCRVDVLTRRAVEQSDNPIRRRSILASAPEIYGA
jgi:zinc-ribbon domain